MLQRGTSYSGKNKSDYGEYLEFSDNDKVSDTFAKG